MGGMKINQWILLFCAASVLSIGLVASYAMIVDPVRGTVWINNYNEGWIESLWYLLLGVISFYVFFKEAKYESI